MNMLLSTLIVISISVFSQSLSHAFKGEPEHGLEERFAKLEDVKQLLLQLEDLQQRIFILENSRSIEDDVQQNKVDIQEVKEDVVDIRINEARTDQLLSSAFSQLKNISSDVVDIKETITNIKKNVADIKVELPPIGSIIAWLPTIALPQDLPGRDGQFSLFCKMSPLFYQEHNNLLTQTLFIRRNMVYTEKEKKKVNF